MSSRWFYLKPRWIGRAKQMGPISEHDLLLKIEAGKIKPETLLMSEKTHEKWVPMAKVGPAFDRWRKSHPSASA